MPCSQVTYCCKWSQLSSNEKFEYANAFCWVENITDLLSYTLKFCHNFSLNKLTVMKSKENFKESIKRLPVPCLQYIYCCNWSQFPTEESLSFLSLPLFAVYIMCIWIFSVIFWFPRWNVFFVSLCCCRSNCFLCCFTTITNPSFLSSTDLLFSHARSATPRGNSSVLYLVPINVFWSISFDLLRSVKFWNV